MKKIVVRLYDGLGYTATIGAETLATMEVAASIEDIVAGMADALEGDEGSVKLNVDGIGWVVFNTRHVAAIEFHGTEGGPMNAAEEPFCACGHDESEHGSRKICWGSVGDEKWCTCAGYRELADFLVLESMRAKLAGQLPLAASIAETAEHMRFKASQ